MEWQIIIALVIAIPVILFPAAFVWYLNIGGIFTAVKEARARRAISDRAKDETEDGIIYHSRLRLLAVPDVSSPDFKPGLQPGPP